MNRNLLVEIAEETVSKLQDGIGLDNSSIGIGLGRGWKEDETRGIIYFRARF